MKKNITIILLCLISLSVFGQDRFVRKEFNDNGSISFMRFGTDKKKLSSTEILGLLKDSLGVRDGNSLHLLKTVKDDLGFEHQYYDQYYQGVRVEYGKYSVHLKAGQIDYVTGNYQPVKGISAKPKLQKNAALASALKLIGATKYIWEDDKEQQDLKRISGKDSASYFPKGELTIIKDIFGRSEEYRLAYKFDIYALSPVSHKIYYIDANNGSLLYADELIKHACKHLKGHSPAYPSHLHTQAKLSGFSDSNNSKNYFTILANSPAIGDTRYSGNQSFISDSFAGGYRLRETRNGVTLQTLNMLNQGTSYASATDFVDGDNNWSAAEFDNSNKDNAALDAHWATEKVYDYFFYVHGRNSWNNQGGALLNYVHANLLSFGYSDNDNAFWDGQRMTYGDGSTFSPLTSLDVVAHEIGHGVMSSSANLAYKNESGALNEGFSDIWAACIEGTYAPAKQRWQIGEDLYQFGTPLRSMSTPKTGSLTKQPNTYGGTYWYNTVGCTPGNSTDQCGVHTNSGVLNYWFYLLVEGGSGTNDIGNSYSLSGIGLADAARIAYRSISVIITNPEATFSVARSATIQAAIDLFGAGSCQEIAVTTSWYAVGVGGEYPNTTTISGPATFCSTQSYSVTDPSLIWSATTVAGGSCTLSGTTGSAVTVSSSTPGKSILRASKTVCGVTISSTKVIYYGAPLKSLLSIRGQNPGSNPNQPGIYGIIYDEQNVCGSSNNKASLINIQWEVSPSASNISEGSMACSMEFPYGAGKTITFGSTGTKYIRIRAQNACGWSDWTDWASYRVNISGSSGFAFMYYPNPAADELNISYGSFDKQSAAAAKSEQSDGPFRVRLFNNKSQVLTEVNSRKGEAIRIDTKDIPDGTYFLHLIKGKETEKKQVIIRH